MQSLESVSALLGLDATPLVLLDLHSHFGQMQPGARMCWELTVDAHLELQLVVHMILSNEIALFVRMW